jgi:hypothetical protein
LGFGKVGVVGGWVREGFIAGFGERKKLAPGYTVLVGVGFCLRTQLRAERFLGAFLTKQKAPPFVEGASVCSGGLHGI